MSYIKDLFSLSEEKTSAKNLFIFATGSSLGLFLIYLLITQLRAKLALVETITAILVPIVFVTGFFVGALIGKVVINAATWIKLQAIQASNRKKELLIKKEKEDKFEQEKNEELKKFRSLIEHLNTVETMIIEGIAFTGDTRLSNHQKEIREMNSAKLIKQVYDFGNNESLYGLPSPEHQKIVLEECDKKGERKLKEQKEKYGTAIDNIISLFKKDEKNKASIKELAILKDSKLGYFSREIEQEKRQITLDRNIYLYLNNKNPNTYNYVIYLKDVKD